MLLLKFDKKYRNKIPLDEYRKRLIAEYQTKIHYQEIVNYINKEHLNFLGEEAKEQWFRIFKIILINAYYADLISYLSLKKKMSIVSEELCFHISVDAILEEEQVSFINNKFDKYDCKKEF